MLQHEQPVLSLCMRYSCTVTTASDTVMHRVLGEQGFAMDNKVPKTATSSLIKKSSCTMDSNQTSNIGLPEDALLVVTSQHVSPWHKLPSAN